MRLLQSIIRYHSRKVIAAFAAAALVAAYIATGVHIDASVEKLMTANDPARELDRLSKEEFGSDEVLLVGFDLGRPFVADDLRRLSAISERVSMLETVERVRDLTVIEDIRGEGESVDASRLVDFDELDQTFDAVAARATSHRLYEKLLVSKDRDVLSMFIYPIEVEDDPELLNRMTAAVVAVVEEEAADWKVHYAGYPYTAYEVNRIIKGDFALLTPVGLLVIGAILFFVTRQRFPLALLLVLIAWSELVAHAALALLGAPINAVVSMLPTMLMATSATYCIYTVGMMARTTRDPDPGVALIPLLYKPVILSSASTGIGFASMSLIDVQAIADLAFALSAGILASALATLLLIPSIVQLFDLRSRPRRIALLDGWAKRVAKPAETPWAVVAVAAVILAVSVPGLLRVTVHTDTLSYFKDDSRARSGAMFFQEHLSNGFLINVVLRGEEGDALKPETLQVAQRIVDRLDESPNVDRTISMLDYFYMIDAALRPGEEPRTIPESREMAAQYLLLYEASGDPADYGGYINYDRSALNIVVPMHGGSGVYIDTAAEIDGLVTGTLPAGLAVDVLGSTFLYSKAMDGLTRGMLYGLATAMSLIFLVLIVGLGSVKLAALAMIPNVAPLMICGGAMGWLDIPLAMGTSIVGCVAIGLAVDDTTHVLGHLDRETSLEHTYAVVGPPVVLTTIALGLGFSVFMLSEFQSIVGLGIACAATLVVALLADLYLLPSLLALAGFRVRDPESEAVDSVEVAESAAEQSVA